MHSSHDHFTYVRDLDLEEQLGCFLERLRPSLADLGSSVEVYLGGGYGRGEGGVRYDASGQGHLYNDLDFFVFTDGVGVLGRRRLDSRFRSLGAELSGELGISVDFGPAKGLCSLRREGANLMYQELRMGHVWVHGDGHVLAAIPELSPSALSPHEGIRLLWNRGMGLLWAGERLSGCDAYDLDFIVRNIHKCALGSGDAELLRVGGYRWSCDDRLAALSSLGSDVWCGSALSCYERAHRFKVRPSLLRSREEAASAWEEVCGLWCREVELYAGGSGTGVFSGLLGVGLSCGHHGFRECLRRVRRMGVRGLGRGMSLDPVYGLLSALYDRLSSGLVGCRQVAHALHHQWRFFT